MKYVKAVCLCIFVVSAQAATHECITNLVSELVSIAEIFDSLVDDERDEAGLRSSEITDEIVRLADSASYVSDYLVQQVLHYAETRGTKGGVDFRCMMQLSHILGYIDRTAFLSTMEKVYRSGCLCASHRTALLALVRNVRAEQITSPGENDFTDEHIRAFFIEAAGDPNPDVRVLAGRVLLGSSSDGPYGPLDLEAGERTMQNFINEEANILEKVHGYRFLLTRGLASNQYTSFLEASVADTNVRSGVRLRCATELREMGELDDAELEAIKMRIMEECMPRSGEK